MTDGHSINPDGWTDPDFVAQTFRVLAKKYGFQVTKHHGRLAYTFPSDDQVNHKLLSAEFDQLTNHLFIRRGLKGEPE